jgi:hypothetical protein
MAKRKPFQAKRSFPLEWWTKTYGAASTEHPVIEGTVEQLTGRARRAERRIAAFIAKHQVEGEQWGAWISFQAIAQHCAKLRTPRKAAAGKAGMKFAYRELVQAVARGEFSIGVRCRVLLLVSHGGKVLSITPGELLEAQEAFDPQTFETGCLNNCWAYAGLVSQWFRSRRVPPPWHSETRPVLHIPRGRHFGAADHAVDVAVIDLALKMKAEHKIRDRAAVRAAISNAHISDKSGSVADRLRAKLRKRRKLRRKNTAS